VFDGDSATGVPLPLHDVALFSVNVRGVAYTVGQLPPKTAPTYHFALLPATFAVALVPEVVVTSDGAPSSIPSQSSYCVAPITDCQVKVTGDVTSPALSAGALSAGAVVLHALCVTTTEDDATLFELFDSGVAELTDAPFVIVAGCCGAFTVMVIVEEVSAVRSGRVHVSTVALCEQFQPLATTFVGVEGNVSESETLLASAGPLFAIVIVNETGEPVLTDVCDGDIASARSAVGAPTLTVFVPFVLQPFAVTVALSVSDGPLPAVKAIVFVPCPFVIVPPVIVQL